MCLSSPWRAYQIRRILRHSYLRIGVLEIQQFDTRNKFSTVASPSLSMPNWIVVSPRSSSWDVFKVGVLNLLTLLLKSETWVPSFPRYVRHLPTFVEYAAPCFHSAIWNRAQSTLKPSCRLLSGSDWRIETVLTFTETRLNIKNS